MIVLVHALHFWASGMHTCWLDLMHCVMGNLPFIFIAACMCRRILFILVVKVYLAATPRTHTTWQHLPPLRQCLQWIFRLWTLFWFACRCDAISFIACGQWNAHSACWRTCFAGLYTVKVIIMAYSSCSPTVLSACLILPPFESIGVWAKYGDKCQWWHGDSSVKSWPTSTNLICML